MFYIKCQYCQAKIHSVYKYTVFKTFILSISAYTQKLIASKYADNMLTLAYVDYVRMFLQSSNMFQQHINFGILYVYVEHNMHVDLLFPFHVLGGFFSRFKSQMFMFHQPGITHQVCLIVRMSYPYSAYKVVFLNKKSVPVRTIFCFSVHIYFGGNRSFLNVLCSLFSSCSNKTHLNTI